MDALAFAESAAWTFEMTRSEQGLYRQILDGLPHAIYVLELDPVAYVYANPAFEQLLGVDIDEFRHDRHRLLGRVHPDDLQTMSIDERTRRRDGEPFSIRFRATDGSWRTLQLKEHIVRDDAHRPVMLQGTVTDVTDRQQRAERLAASLAREQAITGELTRLREMQATFLQAVSHELRTPLTVIAGVATTLDRHAGQLDADAEADLRRRLLLNTERLEGLLSDLLDVDRLTRGVIRARRRWVDLTELVSRTVTQLDLEDDRVVLPRETVQAHVDAAQVERIVENLVANAHRHTPPGTTITIALHRTKAATELTVEDDGPGLPAGNDLFDPFVQGASPEPQPGTGIGLALVQRFAQLHGGDVEAGPSTAGGARFCVTFPDDDPDASTAQVAGEGR